MIFFVGNDGTIIKSVPSPVYQGSVNANNIYMIAPFASGLSATVAFKLPNGVWTERYPMTQINEITGVINKTTGETYSGWQFSIPNEITRYYGVVTAQFFFYATGSNVVTATSSTTFNVDQGVPNILPDSPPQDVYDLILHNISLLQQQLNNGTYTARSISPWNSTYVYNGNEITFYPDKGQYGTFVKSNTDNNNQPPYLANGQLNARFWTEIADFDELNNLIGLNDRLEEVIEETQQAAATAVEAAQNAENDAAKALIAANAAQAAAKSVEDTIDYIDGIKGGSIAVPKAIGDDTGASISNQFASVKSDIEGLRKDIINESHFRGMYQSVEALRTAHPTATPNDYAYIVGGNIYIWTDGAWTDSGVPAPATAIPLSDDSPLMDGTASPGTSSQASRSDHRHPQDTTKANAVDLSNEIRARQNADTLLATGISKNFYNLGKYDTFVSNGNGTVTINRKTFYNADGTQTEAPAKAQYSETVIENQPIHTLDGNGENWLRQEWLKGVNLLDDTAIRGQTLPNFSQSYLLPFKITAGTYTSFVSVNNGNASAVNVLGLYLRRADGTNIKNISNQAQPNAYATFTVSEEEAAETVEVLLFYNHSALEGATLDGIMISEGAGKYPYQPYLGGLVRQADLSNIDLSNIDAIPLCYLRIYSSIIPPSSNNDILLAFSNFSKTPYVNDIAIVMQHEVSGSAVIDSYLTFYKIKSIEGNNVKLGLEIAMSVKGAKGDKGDKGDTGNPGATFELNGTVLTITYN